MVTLEIRSRSPKSNLFNYPNDTIHQVWPESIIWFKRYGADKFFWLKFDIQSAGATLKMRSRSPKSNNFFLMSHWCFCASLVKIHPLVQEIECRQCSFLVFIVWWPWKLSQGHQNLINSFNYLNDTIQKVWPEYTIWPWSRSTQFAETYLSKYFGSSKYSVLNRHGERLMTNEFFYHMTKSWFQYFVAASSRWNFHSKSEPEDRPSCNAHLTAGPWQGAKFCTFSQTYIQGIKPLL